MVPILLAAPLRASAPPASQEWTSDARAFFADDDGAIGRHYLVVDQRGSDSAEDVLRLLEAAFDNFERFLRWKPKLESGSRLRVEVLSDAWKWQERLDSRGIDPRGLSGNAHYDPASGYVFAKVHEIEYLTRADLLGACMRQFHHQSKPKNHSLIDDWFVTGISEMARMHRWDGKRLDSQPDLLLSPIDMPALAQRALLNRSVPTGHLTNEFLEEPPAAWLLASFLMYGEGGRYRRRFQKLALGHKGSMLDGEQVALSLGPQEQALPAIEAWLESVQLPLEVLSGDFEDLGGGRLRGRAHERRSALASPRAPASRIRCTFLSEPEQGAGLFLDYRSPYFFTYAMVANGRLWTFEVERGKHREIDAFQQPESLGRRIELEAVWSDGQVELTVDGRSVGSLAVERERMGLIVQVGAATIEGLEWE